MRLDGAGVRCGTLERMPKWLVCIPLVVQWICLAARYGSGTLPAAANSRITAGGLIGEGKLEYFAGMGSTARASLARYLPIRVAERVPSEELSQLLLRQTLTFPLIAKPDVGFCGYGVRFVADIESLQDYLESFPKGETVVIQEWLPQEGEAGIFYVRDPKTDCSSLIGLALRYFPQVIGDGEQTIDQLISVDQRLRRIKRTAHQMSTSGARVAAKGERVRLATIGSTRVGGLYRDGADHITTQLLVAIDAIARDMPEFYFGRFDVRFGSLDELRRGVGFKIIEVNGAGSEAIQAWDPDISFFQALQTIFAKQRTLFRIGAARRDGGVEPIKLAALARLFWRQQKLISLYPHSN